jgi:hypothetical protein
MHPQVGVRTIEITQVCDLFLGPAGRRAYSACLCVFTYGVCMFMCVCVPITNETQPQHALSRIQARSALPPC